MPIVTPTRTACIILEQHVGEEGYGENIGGGWTYSEDACKPLFLPVFGKYNDYGSLKDVDKDWNSKFVLNFFKSTLNRGDFSKGEAGIFVDVEGRKLAKERKEKFESRDERIDGFDKVEDILEAIERSRLSYKAFVSKMRHLCFMLVREDVYKAAIECTIETANKEMKARLEWDKEFKYMDYRTLLKKDADLYIKFLHDVCEKETRHPNIFGAWARDSMMIKWEELYGDKPQCSGGGNWGNQFASLMGGYLLADYHYGIAHSVREGKLKPDSKEWKERRDTMVDWALFYRFMPLSRKTFIPQCGGGSQSQEFDHFSRFSQRAIEIAQKELNKEH